MADSSKSLVVRLAGVDVNDLASVGVRSAVGVSVGRRDVSKQPLTKRLRREEEQHDLLVSVVAAGRVLVPLAAENRSDLVVNTAARTLRIVGVERLGDEQRLSATDDGLVVDDFGENGAVFRFRGLQNLLTGDRLESRDQKEIPPGSLRKLLISSPHG